MRRPSAPAALLALAMVSVATPAIAAQADCSARDIQVGGGRVHGGQGDDVIVGGSGELHGDEDNDRIYGGAQSVRAFGDEGDDVVAGGRMADDLDGGPGKDVLMGGLGADHFTYRKASHSPVDADGRWSAAEGDMIVDFSRGDGDRIELSGLLHGGPRLRWSNRFPRAYGVWAAVRGGDTIVFVDTTGDERADLAVRLRGSLRLSAGDFCGVD